MAATTDTPPPPDVLDRLSRDGFVVVKSILSPSQLAELRAAAAAAASAARLGQCSHVRVVGKQFPPWDPSTAAERGIWGVQHLMSPDLPLPPPSDAPQQDQQQLRQQQQQKAAFTRIYFSDALLGIVKQLLRCDDADLVMELFNMLVRPEHDFELRWHRDDIPPEAAAEEETARLSEPAYHAQYNLALYEDNSLAVVPGSHLRSRTDVERAADPYEPHMPGQLVVRLEPGDVVFYNNNILHRGVYDAGKERLTLHGSVGHGDGSALRARNVLQHGVGGWVERCDLTVLRDERERKRAEGMRERLLEMGRSVTGTLYSLEG